VRTLIPIPTGLDEQFLETPWYGSRQMARHLRRQGYSVDRKRIRRVMWKMGLQAVYQRPRTTVPHPDHKKWPYLLRGLDICRPNHVWCADITYIPMRRGFLYLVAVMDWASRRVLAWRLSNTMDVDFCIAALEEAMARHGKPEIFNTDQGSQFTSPRFTKVLTDAGVRISMDGRGRWMDPKFHAETHTDDQSLEIQHGRLAAVGCERMFEEKISGTVRGRPALEKLIDHLRKDDVLVVTRLDRLARSTIELLHIAERVIEKNMRDYNLSMSHGPIRRRRPA
jgi:transposase InsO family protein